MKRELRLVLTRKCNYDCTFCHGEGVEKNCEDLLNTNDYYFLLEFCKKKYGWDTVTLTGGEPLIRNDIEELVAKLNEINYKITIVSNGELIDKNLSMFENIERLNVSIHSFEDAIYNNIIKRKDKLQKVIKNLVTLRNTNPDLNIRINSTIVKGQNNDIQDYKKLIDFSKRIQASIKIVELYPDTDKNYVPIQEIKNKFIDLGFMIKDEFTHKIILFDGVTEVHLTKIFCSGAKNRYNSNKYCNQYNDLFVSPNAEIKLCRYIENNVSILKEIKNRDEIALDYKINLASELLGNNCPLMKSKEELAINGGVPVLNNYEGKFIHPKITNKIEKSVVEQLHDTISIYDSSSIFKKFETEFAAYHNKKYALLTSSGTSALHSLYDSIGLNSKDEVICPIYTFFATVSPIFQTGAKPVFVDCDDTGNIDYKKIEEKITKNTKAIMVTHMWGYPCKMDEIRNIADRYDLYLLEDCSHAHGGSYKGKKLGTWGDAAAFSLQGNKIITGGEGGVIITNNKYIYKNCVMLGHYNKRCKQELSKNSIDYKYAVTGKGLKLRAHPLAIRIAYELFLDLDIINKNKNRMVEIIEKTVNEISGIKLNKGYKNSINSYYALMFKFDQKKFKCNIKEFVKALNEEGAIEFDIPGSTLPLNRLELFRSPNFLYSNYENNIINEDELYEGADNFYANTFKMPVWYDDEDLNIVIKYCNALKKVANYYKKER